MDQPFHSRFDKFVGIDKPDTLTSTAFEAAEFTASRLQWEHKEAGHPVKFDRAEGFMLCLQRRELPSHPYWVEDRPEKMATQGGPVPAAGSALATCVGFQGQRRLCVDLYVCGRP